MGISGLLPALVEITRKKHISAYKGKVVAIDAYCWLHKGSWNIASELYREQHGMTKTWWALEKLLKYCVSRLKVMLEAGVTPIMVFDGANLPSKQGTEKERADKRQEALKQAR